MSGRSTSHYFAAISLAVGCALAVCEPSARAQTAPPAADNPEAQLGADFTTAMDAFSKSDYATAASRLENIVAKAGPGAQLESIYYTLGASYFNLEQYAKAASTLETYLQKYPQGARVQDATFSLAQAYLASKQYPLAAAQFAKLESVPELREQALYYEGLANKEGGQNEQAIAALTKLIEPEIRTTQAADGAMLLVGLYAQTKQSEKANALMAKLVQSVALVQNVVRLNSMTVQLGDTLLASGQPKEALEAYRSVKSRDEVVQFQQDRLAAIRQQITQNLAAIQSDPKQVTRYVAANNQLKGQYADAQKVLKQAQDLPDFAPTLLVRMAQAYYQLGEKWEANVVYDEILTRFPNAKEREMALFGKIVACAETNLIATTRKLADQYLKEFPEGPNANTVGYLMGASALQANDAKDAEQYFGRMLTEQPNSSFREEMRFLLGGAKFAQAKYDDASAVYAQYLQEYPSGTHREEAAYRIAVGNVFAGKYEAGMKQLESFLKDYPTGALAADAKYRLAVCLYAASQYQDVIDRMAAWEKDYGSNALQGEVLALHADSLAALDKNDEAVPLYIHSYQAATSEEVLSYSLFAAQKLLQKAGNWDAMSQMFQEFIAKKPDDPNVVMAMYWVGKSMARAGHYDEAKTYVAGKIKKYIDDPKREAVEPLLSQLAQLCARKKPAASAPETDAPEPAAAASPTPAPAVDPGAELQALLGTDGQSPTGKARVMYAKAELAKLRRNQPEADKLMLAMGQQFKPEDLSPTLIAQAGDALLNAHQAAKAAPFFQLLIDQYPKSDVLDFAYNGLGELAFETKDYPKALKYYTDAIEKIGATQKLKDVTVGKAKTLFAMGRLDEAQKQFEQVAGAREWRGESTAFAVYSLGDIQFQRGNWAAANAYFQRVYVAYQKFLPWVAKAYLMSGECFEKLSKTPEAAKTYQEMLRNDKLANFEETGVARQKLQQLGAAQG